MEELPVPASVISAHNGLACHVRNQGAIKETLVNLAPAAFLVLVVMFWTMAPKSLTGSEWMLIVATTVTTLAVLALEFVHERNPDWRMTWREFFTDFFYVVLNATVIGWASNTLVREPLTAAKKSLGINTEWVLDLPFVIQVALVIFIIEIGQYWIHRLMHNWTPFWLTHAPHHYITQLNAAKGAVGNPIELFLISLSVVALFDVSLSAMFCAINVLSLVSAFAHANVRSDPPKVYSLFFTTIRHHSLHHSTDYQSTRCNYANSLILLDRLFGTYREGEAAIVGQGDLKRLSIKEQFLFPFEPLIERARSKREQAATTSN